MRRFSKPLILVDLTTTHLYLLQNWDAPVVIKLHTAPNANKEAIHRSFMQGYQKALKAAEQKYKDKLHAQDREIQIYRQQSASMQTIAEALANRPITLNAKAIAGNNDVNDNSNNVSITGNVSGSTINFGEINGQVTNQINQLPPATPGQTDLKALLSQFQAVIQNESKLSEASKACALEQLGEIAKAGQNPQDSAMKKAAKQSMVMLNNLAVVSGAVQMVLFIKQAWPLIRGFFGL